MYGFRPRTVTVDFINGYLAPIALMMDYSTSEVAFDYYFRSLDGASKQYDLTETVRELLKRTLEQAKDHRGKPQYAAAYVNELVSEHYYLALVENWRANLSSHISYWLGQRFIDLLGPHTPNTPWLPTFLVDDFVQVLLHFFGEVPTECWTIEGRITDDLFYHWGGVQFDDYFFSSGGNFYHLHFHCTD